MLARDEERQMEEEEGGFSLFSTKPVKKRHNILRPIVPRACDNMVQYERPILDVPYKSLPCQAHFIRGNCPMGDSCYFYHSVQNASLHMRHVEPTHPIVLNYRIQKLAHERGQGHFVSNVHEKMDILNRKSQNEALREMIQRNQRTEPMIDSETCAAQANCR